MDAIGPTVVITSPASSEVAGTVTVAATAVDDRGVASVLFLIDGTPLGPADTRVPFSAEWNTVVGSNGPHVLQVVAEDLSGNVTTATRSITVLNTGSIHVLVDVTGASGDPDGIGITVDGVQRGTVPGSGGALTLDDLETGTHALGLTDLVYYCGADLPGAVEIAAEQTTTVTLSVECETPLEQSIAYARRDDTGYTDIFRLDGNGTVVNLTNSPRRYESDPAWSPDGSKIAFTAWDDEIFWEEIFVMNSDGSGVTRLTFDQAWDIQPVWSPDGAKIVYGSEPEPYISGWIDGHMRHRLVVMDADGGDRRQITFGDDYTQHVPGAWSRDGSRILVQRYFFADDTDESDLLLIDPDGGHLTVVLARSGGSAPSWSPDEADIIFASYTRNPCCDHDISVTSSDGTALAKLTNSRGVDEAAPVWTRDGSMVVFLWDYRLAVMSADGSGRRLIDTGVTYSRPTLSP